MTDLGGGRCGRRKLLLVYVRLSSLPFSVCRISLDDTIFLWCVRLLLLTKALFGVEDFCPICKTRWGVDSSLPPVANLCLLVPGGPKGAGLDTILGQRSVVSASTIHAKACTVFARHCCASGPVSDLVLQCPRRQTPERLVASYFGCRRLRGCHKRPACGSSWRGFYCNRTCVFVSEAHMWVLPAHVPVPSTPLCTAVELVEQTISLCGHQCTSVLCTCRCLHCKWNGTCVCLSGVLPAHVPVPTTLHSCMVCRGIRSVCADTYTPLLCARVNTRSVCGTSFPRH